MRTMSLRFCVSALALFALGSTALAADTADTADTGDGTTEPVDDDTGTAANDTAYADDGTYGGLGVAALASEKGGWGCESSAGGVLFFGFLGLGMAARKD